MVLSAKALETLGVAPAEVADISIHDRDRRQRQLELASALQAGRAPFSGEAGP